MKAPLLAVFVAAFISLSASEAKAGGLRGSRSSMKEQHDVAVKRDLTFIDDAAEVSELVDSGSLQAVESTADLTLSRVSFPYAVPETKLFIERLARQYREANGYPLVVTSLTRPASRQPRNAHELSVHPAGMAVDFRVPQSSRARAWLESALLQLENAGVLDVTRERNPPHYHVAVFPAAYADYVAPRLAAERAAAKKNAEAEAAAARDRITHVQTPPIAAPAPVSSIERPDLPLALAGLAALAFASLFATNRYARTKSTR